MNRSEYDKIQALNFSSLKYILESPAKYQVMLGEVEQDESKYAVGTLAHAMVLENKDLRGKFAIKPKGMSFASTEGKEWKKAQTLPILKEEDSNAVERMAEAIAMDPDAANMLKACIAREYVIECEIDGIPFKSLLDAVGHDTSGRAGFIDIKTTTDAGPFGFSKKVQKLHYDMQAEIYARAIQATEKTNTRPWCAWIVVEDKPPFEVATYYPDETIIKAGRLKLATAIARYKSCLAAGIWPKAHGGLTMLKAAPFSLESIPEPLSSHL
jgi:hypothetical protein